MGFSDGGINELHVCAIMEPRFHLAAVARNECKVACSERAKVLAELSCPLKLTIVDINNPGTDVSEACNLRCKACIAGINIEQMLEISEGGFSAAEATETCGIVKNNIWIVSHGQIGRAHV